MRKQYVAKQKPPSMVPTVMPTPERPETPSNIRPHSRSYSPGKHHDEVTTPNPFVALKLEPTEEEAQILILPITALETYPIDNDE